MIKKKKKDFAKCTHPNVFIIITDAGDWLGFKENEVKVIHKGPLQIKRKQDTRQKKSTYTNYSFHVLVLHIKSFL